MIPSVLTVGDYGSDMPTWPTALWVGLAIIAVAWLFALLIGLAKSASRHVHYFTMDEDGYFSCVSRGCIARRDRHGWPA